MKESHDQSVRRDEPVWRWLTFASIVTFVTVMTLHPSLTRFNLDSYGDMVENYAWGIAWEWGYHKHPPLFAWITAAWFAVFPNEDWAYYLLSAVNAGVTVWLIWLIAARYFDERRRFIAALVAPCLPPLFFLAIKYNANSAMLPFWAATFLFYLRVIERRSLLDALLLGFFAALAMLTKYYSAVLIGAIGLHAVFDRDVRPLFATALPWLAGLAFLAVLSPHLWWLVEHDFLPMRYASDQGPGGRVETLESVPSFVGALVLYVLPALLPLVVMFKPPRRGFFSELVVMEPWRKNALGRAVLWVLVASLVLTIVLALATGALLSSVWVLPVFVFVPVIIAAWPRARVARRSLKPAIVTVAAVYMITLAATPLIRRYELDHPSNNSVVPLAAITRQATELWRREAGTDLGFAAGMPLLANGMAFYSPLRPQAIQALSLELTPWASPDAIAREGIVTLCLADDRTCRSRMQDLVEAPDFERILGVPGFGNGANRPVWRVVVAGLRPKTSISEAPSPRSTSAPQGS